MGTCDVSITVDVAKSLCVCIISWLLPFPLTLAIGMSLSHCHLLLVCICSRLSQTSSSIDVFRVFCSLGILQSLALLALPGHGLLTPGLASGPLSCTPTWAAAAWGWPPVAWGWPASDCSTVAPSSHWISPADPHGGCYQTAAAPPSFGLDPCLPPPPGGVCASSMRSLTARVLEPLHCGGLVLFCCDTARPGLDQARSVDRRSLAGVAHVMITVIVTTVAGAALVWIRLETGSIWYWWRSMPG